VSVFDPNRRRPNIGLGPNSSLEPIEQMLQTLLHRPSTSDVPEPIPTARLSEMLRQDYAPEPVVPKYPPLRGFGYRLPIIPPRELPAPPPLELLGVPVTLETENTALIANLLKVTAAERERTTRNELMAVETTQSDSGKDRAEQQTKAKEAPMPVLAGQGTRNQASEPKILHVGPPTNAQVDETAMVGALKFDPAGPSERQLIILHPIDAYRANDAAKESLQATISRFPQSQLHNGPGDAFRHALWSYKLARLLGPERAKEITDSHEISHANNGSERLMDLYNNEVGRRLATGPVSQQKTDEEVVLEALQRGELQQRPFSVLPGTELASPAK
jgi:hypothetical protein